jgi:hypothetical protein
MEKDFLDEHMEIIGVDEETKKRLMNEMKKRLIKNESERSKNK